MAKQAFNQVFRYPATGDLNNADSHTTFTNTYTVPQNKRLIFRVIIPYRSIKLLQNYEPNAIESTAGDTPRMAFNIPGVITLGYIDTLVQNYTTTNGHYSDIISPVLIAKAGSEIKIRAIDREQPTFSTTSALSPTGTGIEDFAYINGFLEDDV